MAQSEKWGSVGVCSVIAVLRLVYIEPVVEWDLLDLIAPDRGPQACLCDKPKLEGA